MMFSNGNVEKLDDRQPEMLLPPAQNPRVLSNARKSRSGVGPDGKPLPKSQVIALRDAIFEAMLHRFSIDPTMAAFGEENRDWGGAFAVYRGLTEALPYHRLFNTSISEGAIVGAAVGYALSGGRAVPELMYCDFLGRSGDEVFNQVCKWQAMSANVLKMPLVLRVSVGSKYGAQHSQDWSSLVAHLPGLKVMFPVTPYDAKGMLNLALRGTDPVVFLESQRMYDVGELFVPGGVPEGYYEVDEGEPAVRRERQRPHDRHHRSDAVQGAGDRGYPLVDVRGVRRSDRCAVHQPAAVREDPGLGAKDRPLCPGLRRVRARFVPPHDGLEHHADGIRFAGCTGCSCRGAQLDHALRGDGRVVLPAERMDSRHDPREDRSAEWPRGDHRAGHRGDAAEKRPGV